VSAVNPFVYGALDKKLFSSFKLFWRKKDWWLYNILNSRWGSRLCQFGIM
jgi:hypothetical protein